MSSAAAPLHYSRPGGIEVVLSPLTAARLQLSRDEAWERDGAREWRTYQQTQSRRMSRINAHEVTMTSAGLDARAALTPKPPALEADEAPPAAKVRVYREPYDLTVFREVSGGWKTVGSLPEGEWRL
jgi:hypothetical protein